VSPSKANVTGPTASAVTVATRIKPLRPDCDNP
jgi:hypothetical protein